MLGPDDGRLGEKSIANAGLDVFDLLDSFLFGEPVQEEIDIGRRAELFVVELAKTTLGAVVLVRDGKKSVGHRGSRGNHVAPEGRRLTSRFSLVANEAHKHVPVEFGERRLGEYVEVALELLEGRNNGRRTVWPPNLGWERHDVFGAFLLGFGRKVASPDLGVGGVLGEEREDIDVGILEQLIVRVLGESLAEMGLILAVRLQQFDHGCLRVLVDVVDQAGQGHRQSRGSLGRHLDDHG